MRNVRKIFAIALIGFLLAGTNAYAGPFVKFGRGLTNIILSPAEIMYQPMKLNLDNNTAIAWIGGVPKGIVYFPIRALAGVYDVVTFLIPYPEDYGYWMEPETLVEGFEQI